MITKILCRADGSSNIGLGHMYRMFAIIEFYKKDYEIHFITKESSSLEVVPSDYNVITIPDDITLVDEANWLVNKFEFSKSIVIADGYHFDSKYQKAIKDAGYKLMYIDDLANEHMYADIVINHSPHFTHKDYKREAYTKLKMGTKYAMLRPTFLNCAKRKRLIINIENVFVCFGGADPYNLSFKAVKALIRVPSIKKIHLVLGAAYNHLDIFNLLKETNKLKIYRNLGEKGLSELMLDSHFAIVPSSTILYELCSVKMPVLSGYYVDNQKFIYTALKTEKVIINGGDFSTYNVEDFEIKINDIIKKNSFDSYIENQQNLFDGHMKSRFLGLVNQFNLGFRKANENDAKLIFNWSNDSLVRKQSFNSEEIEWEHHLKWYNNKIKDDKSIFLITLINNKPAGLVRFDVNKDNTTIGILLSNKFRGQKLATAILKKSSCIYFDNHSLPILAYIKKTNLASVKSFEKASYTYFKDDIVKGNSSFVYKLEKEDARK